MKETFGNSIVKCLGFLTLMLTPIILLRAFNNEFKFGQIVANSEEGNNRSLTASCFFIGSSRTQTGINDFHINKNIPGVFFKNMAMPIGTFLINYVIANKLMKSNGRKKILFIELSIINARVPHVAALILSYSDLLSCTKEIGESFTANDKKFILYPLFENFTLKYLRLSSDIKAFVSPDWYKKNIGYLPKTDVCTVAVAFPLRNTEPGDQVAFDQGKEKLYRKVVTSLLNRGYRTQTDIIFYLPLAFNSEEERKRLVSIFNSIPDSNKLSYSSTFLNKMTDPELFFNPTHLNQSGAKEFTSYIENYLREKYPSLIRE